MSSEITYQQSPDSRPFVLRKQDLEATFINKPRALKYTDRPDVRDRASLKANVRQKLEALNRIKLTDDKCLFAVDRKELDQQTCEEFDRFQEGCVEEKTHTETLVRRLLSDDKADKVVVTTIQKLGLARLSKHPRRKRLVLGGNKCLIRKKYQRNTCVSTH